MGIQSAIQIKMASVMDAPVPWFINSRAVTAKAQHDHQYVFAPTHLFVGTGLQYRPFQLPRDGWKGLWA